MKLEGAHGIRPQIKKVWFERGRIAISLIDGREITAPLKLFPTLQKVPAAKRSKYLIADGEAIIFDHCDEVYHIQDFFGREIDYAHR